MPEGMPFEVMYEDGKKTKPKIKLPKSLTNLFKIATEYKIFIKLYKKSCKIIKDKFKTSDHDDQNDVKLIKDILKEIDKLKDKGD